MSIVETYVDETVKHYKEKMIHANSTQMYTRYANELKEYLQNIQKEMI